MAAAKGHVDNSVAERRLRPIYDWLDNGNNKRALQEADKVLKKQPNFLCAKVLRALALLRMGKNEECEAILRVVEVETPTDDATLQAMAICYREMHQTDKICAVYAAAVARDPSNEELLTHLFMSYVRVGDFKRQQQTAMALYKLKPKNPYYFWGVMSVVMQAREVPEATARGVVLPLAERMVHKMVEGNKVEAEQEVQLFLMILEMQDKIEEALHVLEGPLGERLVSHLGLVHTKKAALLSRLGRYRESHLLYKNLIRQEQDRWNYYCEYFRTAAHLWASPPDEDEDEDEDEEQTDPDAPSNSICEPSQKLWRRPDSTPQACADFLTLLQETNEERGEKRLRAPLLAKMELYSRLLESPQVGVDPQAMLGDLVDLIVGYFRPFGGKPCCYSDLRNFLPLLPSERAPELVARLAETLDMPSNQLPQDLSQLRRHMSLVQVSRCLGLHENLTPDERVALANDLLKRYDHGQSLEQGIIATDFPCNDPYAQLACQVLLELGMHYKQDSRLLEAAAILEHALTLSPSNFHFKLLLLKIYSLTGAGSAAQTTFELLDIKHVQLDSLGWLHCAHLSATGHIAMASAHYEATLKFFTANYKDSVDHLTFSYKFGSFLKISEFVEFRDRLHRSHHYTRCTVERMLSELMLASSHEHTVQVLRQMDVTPAEDSIEWDKLRDNRDLEVAMTYDPPYKQVSPEITECTFRREIAILRLRSLQLRCIAAAFELINPPQPNPSLNGECKENLLSTLITQILHFYLPPIPMSRSELNQPIPSRADALAGSAHVSAFVAGLRLANQLAESSQDQQADPVPVLESMVVVLGEVLKAEKQAEDFLDNDQSLLSRRQAIEAAVNTLETLSFMALLCGVYQCLVQPAKSQGQSRKGKKKRDPCTQPTQPRILCGLAELASRLREVCGQLSDCVGRWESRVALEDDAAEKMGRWSLDDTPSDPPDGRRNRAGITEAVSAKLRHSYMATAKELQESARETAAAMRTNLIVNYLPQNMTEKELYAMFCTVGALESCRVMKDYKTGYSYGFGFVNYVRAEDAARAIGTLNGLQVQNKRLKVSYARPSGEDIKDTNLYVTNLPRDITEDGLEVIFGKFGNIVQKNLLKDKMTGMPRGVAFVRYDRREEAQEAIQGLHGVVPETGTEPLCVKIAEEHGKQKAAYYAGWQAGFTQSRGRGGRGGGGQGGGGRGGQGRGGAHNGGGGGGYGIFHPQGLPGVMRPDKIHHNRYNPIGMGGGYSMYNWN